MKGLQTSINAIKAAGFTHIKVELEAELHRGSNGYYDDSKPCDTCDSKGYIDVLNGLGVLTSREECGTCQGHGKTNHMVYNFDDEDQCQSFLKTRLSAEAIKTINFMRFYRDGSVDSEMTFTLPIDHPQYIIEMINAWNELVDANGGFMDVNGAGMHVAILPSGSYPTSNRLPAEKLNNFKSEVTKLLPALYVAAASGNFTRGLSYRRAQISSSTKYSAIFITGGGMEYRIFETCYQRPEAIYEYIGIIARTLEYYTDPTKKVESLGKEFPIYDKHDLKGFTSSVEQVEILKRTMKHVQPSGMTIKDLLQKRGVELKVTKLKATQLSKIRKLKLAYKEHVKSYEKTVSAPLDEYQMDNIEYWKRERPGMEEEWYKARVVGVTPLMPEKDYIKNNIIRERPSVTVAV